MRPSWRTQQFRAADHQDATAALGMPEPWINRAAVTGHLLLILLVAVVLRIRGLDRYSLWYDEVVTMRLAETANPAALILLLGQIDGTRAPLHPLILQGWIRLFGTSELAGRSFSAVCGIITVLVVYRLGQRLFDEPTGRWGAWFTAVCPPLVYYSQETRMYAWMVLLTCLSWLVFTEFRHAASSHSKVAYWLLLTGLVYSHPLGLFMVAAHGLAYWLVHRSLTLDFRSWLAIQVGVLLAIAPWVPRYLDHGTDYSLPRYAIRFLLAVPIEYVGGNSLVLLACALVIAAGLFSLVGQRPRLTCPVESLVLLTWTIAPPVGMYLYSGVGRTIFGPPRYHLFIAPAYLILLARGLCKLPGPLRWAIAAGAFYLSLSMIDTNIYSQVVKADWRSFGQWLSHEVQRGEVMAPKAPVTVVVHPSDPTFPRDQVEAARYFLSPPHRVILANESGAAESTEPEAATLDVYCLSAQQVRAGIRNLSDTGFSAPIWQRAATDWHQGVPELYGLIIRRRLGHVSGR